MKKVLLIILAVLSLSIAVNAQKGAPQDPTKYGEIPMDDMAMMIYSKDSSASALILADYGVAYLMENATGYQVNFDRHVRIKILTKDGLDWANSSVQLSSGGDEKLQGFKAASYNLENGKITETKLGKDGIFTEKYNKNIDLQKFTIPNVKVGSVIEYSYRKVTYNFPNWQFQRSIPTRISEYWAMFPDVYTFQKYMQGYITLTNVETKPLSYFQVKVIANHYVATDVPAFKPEPFMTTEDDYVSKINFALSHIKHDTYTEERMGSWIKLNEDLLKSESFGKVLDGSGFLKDKVDIITAGITDPMAKVAAISDYVKQNVEYDGDEDWRAYPLKKVLDKKKGSSGDVNLLFGSMLQKAGFETDMVILSTRNHGFIRQEYPMTRQFNYVVCAVKVGEKTLFVDATEKYLPYDILPSRCLNGQGLVISKINHGWVDIVTKAKAKTIVNVDMVLDSSGELKGKVQYIRDGFDAHEMRDSYSKEGEEKYVTQYAKGKQWQISKSEFKDVKELTKSAKEIHDVSIAEHTSVAGDVIYVNPFIASQFTENPFKSDERIYPVDFGTAIDRTYMLKITLPEGYIVDELPKSKVLTLPGNAAKYLYNASTIGNSVSVTSTFTVNKSLFIQSEYPTLKEFYNQMVAKQAEQIVIKKK